MWHFADNVFIPTRSFSNKAALDPQVNLISVEGRKSRRRVREANVEPSNQELENVIPTHFRPEGVLGGRGGDCCIINQPWLDWSKYCAQRALNKRKENWNKAIHCQSRKIMSFNSGLILMSYLASLLAVRRWRHERSRLVQLDRTACSWKHFDGILRRNSKKKNVSAVCICIKQKAARTSKKRKRKVHHPGLAEHFVFQLLATSRAILTWRV